MTWRDNLKIHPAADLFPLLKDTDPAALQALADDIRTNGLQRGIVFYGTGAKVKLLDGRNRLDAMELAGILKLDKCPDGHPVSFAHTVIAAGHGVVVDGKFKKVDPFDYVISVNAHRRHLTAKDKADLIVKVLAAKPEMSNRAVAKAVKVDHHKVAKVRSEGEHVGKIPHVEKHTDSKGRQQPARKSGTPAKRLDELPDLVMPPPTKDPKADAPQQGRLRHVKELVSQLPTADLFRFGRWFKEEIDPEPAYVARQGLPSAVVAGAPAVAAAPKPVQQPEAPAATTTPTNPNIAPTEPAAAAVNALEVAAPTKPAVPHGTTPLGATATKAPTCAKPGGCGYGGCISQGRCLWTPGGMAPAMTVQHGGQFAPVPTVQP
jgi:hypothetical protein